MYHKELQILNKTNRLRERKEYDTNLIDFASNDYLGLASKKKLFKKAYQLVSNNEFYGPKSSQLVNGYHAIHKAFEKKLCEINNFEDGLVVGSGFLANIALIEALVRKKDILFIDEAYHASGMLASKLVDKVIMFKHNDVGDLEDKIKENPCERRIIAIEGVYSMHGDIAPKYFAQIANRYEAILIVDEAHSSGVIGEKLLGWFDYHNLQIRANYIKMGTLGKAYGSYGAYILATEHIISFLVNRAKSIIYTTAPSLMDIAQGLINLEYIQNKKEKIKKKIVKRKYIIKKVLDLETESLILPIEINDNQKVIQIQKKMIDAGFMIGAIRPPTVKKAILRVILKLDIKKEQLKKLLTLLSNHIDCA